MAVNIGPRIGIDGEAEYRKELSRIIQETKTLKSEYDKMASTMDDGAKSIKENAEQSRLLSERIDVQKKRVKELADMVKESSEKYGDADQKTLKWKQALNEAETELNNLEKELKDIPNAIQSVGDSMDRMGENIHSAGQKMEDFGNSLKPISTAAAGGLAAAAKTFIDFESGMSKVAAVSGATGKDLEALTEKAKEMGETTAFSASESAEALYYMGLAGWKTQDMIDGIAPIMNLAAAAGEELGTTSDIVTDALTAFGLEAKDAAHFADVLAAASSNSNTTVGMMGEAFKYAAPVAGSLGYSVEDVSLALGLMANSGIKASMAGTSLRNMINRMAKPTKESETAMNRLGLSLSDNEGNMYSLRQIMDQLRKSFGNINMPIAKFNATVKKLDDELDKGEITEKAYQKEMEELAKQAYGAEGAEKARAAAMLGGTRAMSALLAITNASTDDYNKLTTAIDGSTGAAQKMADTMLNNTQGALTLAKSALEGAGIEAGEVLAPYITKAADAVKDLATKFSGLSQQEQDQIVKMAAVTAAAAPLISGAGKLTKGIGDIVSSGGQFISWLGKLGPEATIAAGAVAVVTGGVIALQEHIDSVNGEKINQVMLDTFVHPGGVPVEELFNSVNGLIDEMSTGFDDIASKSGQLESAQENVRNTVFEMDKIKTSLENGVITAEEAVPKLNELLSNLATNIQTQMGLAGDVLLKTFSDGGALTTAYEATGHGIENVTKRVQEATASQNAKVEELQQKLQNAKPLSDEWYAAYEELVKIGGGVDALQSAEDALNTYMAGNPLNWQKYLDADGELQIGKFQDDLGNTITKAGEFSTAMETNLNSAVEAARQLGDAELAYEIQTGIPGAMDYANAQVASKSTELTDIIQNEAIGGINGVIKKAEESWQNEPLWRKIFIYDNNQAAYTKGLVEQYKKDTIDPLSSSIETSMGEIGVKGAGWASDASSEIIKSLFDVEHNYDETTGADNSTLKLKSNWEQILNATGSAASETAKQRGADVVKGFNQGVFDNTSTSEGEVTTWMDKIKQAIHNSAMRFGSPSLTAQDFGKDTVDGYNSGINANKATSETTTGSWMDSVSSKIESGTNTISKLFSDMSKDTASSMDDAKSSVDSGFGDIKSTFDNTKLKFPEIKLPHFSIDGEFSLNPPKTPKISIDWYSKAMANGVRLTSPTVFGATGSSLMAGGETGNEWVIGENSILNMIRSAVRSSVGYIPEVSNQVTIGDTTIQITVEGGGDAEEIAERVDEIITARYEQARSAWA